MQGAVIIKLQENQGILAISTTREMNLLKEWLPDRCPLPSHKDVHFNRGLAVWWRVWGTQEPSGEQVPLVSHKPGLALVHFWFGQLPGEGEMGQGEERSRDWLCCQWEVACKLRSEGGRQLVWQRELFLGSQKPRERICR